MSALASLGRRTRRAVRSLGVLGVVGAFAGCASSHVESKAGAVGGSRLRSADVPADRGKSEPTTSDAGPETSFSAPASMAARVLAMTSKLDELVETRFAHERTPGLAFGIVVGGMLVYTKVLGVDDLVTREAVTPRTLFRIGSITKTMTAFAALRLVEEGKLELDGPAERYLPALAKVKYKHADAPRITLRHLLRHESGLPRNGWIGERFDFTRPTTAAELAAALAKEELISDPGERSAYSNLGFDVVGLLVDKMDGSLRNRLQGDLFDPLGMSQTVWGPQRHAGPFATPYKLSGVGIQVIDVHASQQIPKIEPRPVALWKLGKVEASGGLFSTLEDMARYATFNLSVWDNGTATGPRLMDPEVWKSAQTADLVPSAMGAYVGLEEGQGLAWWVDRSCDLDYVVGHGGATEGFHSALFMLPRQGVAAIALANLLDAEMESLARAGLRLVVQGTLERCAGRHSQ